MILVGVVAVASPERGIGSPEHALPWLPHRLTADLAWLSKITTSRENPFLPTLNCRSDDSSLPVNTVLLGNTSWNTLPPKFKPLPNRHTVVLSRDANSAREKYAAESTKHLEPEEKLANRQAIEHSASICRPYKVGGNSFVSFATYEEFDTYFSEIHEYCFVLGGSQVYTMELPKMQYLFVTKVEEVQEGSFQRYTAFIPEWEIFLPHRRCITAEVCRWIDDPTRPKKWNLRQDSSGQFFVFEGPFRYSFWIYSKTA